MLEDAPSIGLMADSEQRRVDRRGRPRVGRGHHLVAIHQRWPHRSGRSGHKWTPSHAPHTCAHSLPHLSLSLSRSLKRNRSAAIITAYVR